MFKVLLRVQDILVHRDSKLYSVQLSSYYSPIVIVSCDGALANLKRKLAENNGPRCVMGTIGV